MAQHSWRSFLWLSPTPVQQGSGGPSAHAASSIPPSLKQPNAVLHGTSNAGRPGRSHAAQNTVTHAAAGHAVSLVPYQITKTVHFIRHAEGFHNIGWEDNTDAHLTIRGWQQAAALRHHISATLKPRLDVEVVIVSPLQRTLETAVGVFGGGPGNNGDESCLLMRGQSDAPHERTAHDPVVLPAHGPPFVACEQCRERVGSNRCDRWKQLALTRAQFPGVDFGMVETDEDEWWEREHAVRQTSGCYSLGESEQEVTERGVRFIKWLMSRPEQRIAVVSHAGFIRHTLSLFAGSLPPQPAEALEREFLNCELRTVVLTDSGVDAKDRTWFPGGLVAVAEQQPLTKYEQVAAVH